MASKEYPRLREKLINLAGTLYLRIMKQKRATRKARVIPLNYHKISGGSFRKHLGYIQRHYEVLAPEAFLGWLNDEIIIENPSVVLTFDDGYRSFYEEIYPVLKKNGIGAFMFVPTGFIGKTCYFWADKLQAALEKSDARVIVIDGKKFYLYSRLYRSDFYSKVHEYVRALDEENRNEICSRMFEQLNVRISEDDMDKYRFLNWQEILEMGRSGLVVFGSHTVSHPNLTTLSNHALRHELKESKRILEDCLAKPVSAFAYPYGGQGFFDARVIGELKEAGYSCAFATVQGTIKDKSTDRFRLNRVMLFDYQDAGAVALKIDRY